MWKSRQEIIQADKIVKFRILEEGEELSFAGVIEHWLNSLDFRRYFNSLLERIEFEGYFWEVRPIRLRDLDEAFEFVLVKNMTLPRLSVDTISFSKYFHNNQEIVSFWNLRGDAKLVVPTPKGDADHYTHIGEFVRRGPSAQREKLWQKVGEEYRSLLNNKTPLWLSTSGLVVAWLHIRMDKRPKYYTYKPYKVYKDK